jgi:hypothetical protein
MTKVTESLHGRHSYMRLSRRGSSSGSMSPSRIGIPHVRHGGWVMGTKRLAKPRHLPVFVGHARIVILKRPAVNRAACLRRRDGDARAGILVRSLHA